MCVVTVHGTPLCYMKLNTHFVGRTWGMCGGRGVVACAYRHESSMCSGCRAVGFVVAPKSTISLLRCAAGNEWMDQASTWPLRSSM